MNFLSFPVKWLSKYSEYFSKVFILSRCKLKAETKEARSLHERTKLSFLFCPGSTRLSTLLLASYRKLSRKQLFSPFLNCHLRHTHCLRYYRAQGRDCVEEKSSKWSCCCARCWGKDKFSTYLELVKQEERERGDIQTFNITHERNCERTRLTLELRQILRINSK